MAEPHIEYGDVEKRAESPGKASKESLSLQIPTGLSRGQLLSPTSHRPPEVRILQI